MRKSLVVVSVAILAVVLSAAPVSGRIGGAEVAEVSGPQVVGGPGSISGSSNGFWDPDDVEGRFDLRWIGAVYTSAGRIHLSLSFYDGFDWRLIPREFDEQRNVFITLSSALDGVFVRPSGSQIVFVWGDFGSSCCESTPVTRPSSNVLSVTINPCSYVYGSEIDQAQGLSLWRNRGVVTEDSTGVIHLTPPHCEEST